MSLSYEKAGTVVKDWMNFLFFAHSALLCGWADWIWSKQQEEDLSSEWKTALLRENKSYKNRTNSSESGTFLSKVLSLWKMQCSLCEPHYIHWHTSPTQPKTSRPSITLPHCILFLSVIKWDYLLVVGPTQKTAAARLLLIEEVHLSCQCQRSMTLTLKHEGFAAEHHRGCSCGVSHVLRWVRVASDKLWKTAVPNGQHYKLQLWWNLIVVVCLGKCAAE